MEFMTPKPPDITDASIPKFDKTEARFRIQRSAIYFNHCGIAPLLSEAMDAARNLDTLHHNLGMPGVLQFSDSLDQLHASSARLLKTKSSNMSLVHNTAEALSMIAQSFRFDTGDEIISYIHEYPSNHYPWRLQKQRGVQLKLLPNRPYQEDSTLPAAWSMEDLKKIVSKRTRMIALSHVQFTSGFAADIPELAEFCKKHSIYLILDAAQSLGTLAIYPDLWGVDAVAASAWKWLGGPIGAGLLYTSPALRDRLDFCMAGADLMQQGEDYLDHTWNPHKDGRRFEYSTFSLSSALQIQACLDSVFLHYGVESIRDEILRLQAAFIALIEPRKFKPVRDFFASANHSAILSLIYLENRDPANLDTELAFLVEAAAKKGLVLSTRGGYLRLGIHFYNTLDEVQRAAAILNRLEIP